MSKPRLRNFSFRAEPAQINRLRELADELEVQVSVLVRHGIDRAIAWAEERAEAMKLGAEQLADCQTDDDKL